jgi:homoserine kinase
MSGAKSAVIDKSNPGPLKLRLPASSANLGPGFDAAALAMSLYLEIDAAVAAEFSIDASGRNAEQCRKLDDNLILDTYRDVLGRYGRAVTPLAITMRNGIPLGMGCGSSAAGILAGVALAAHFGGLQWGHAQILDEACRIEGHPDNVAACWLGGMTVSTMVDGKCVAASVTPPEDWGLVLVLPNAPLSTKKARALLPEQYSRADTVFNVQRMALLTAAFAQGRGDLLALAMQDRMHQPYRAPLCSLLGALEPLAGSDGILGVALSGAGPSVLLVVEKSCDSDVILNAVKGAIGNESAEIVQCVPERYAAMME